ncbi:MAG: acetyl-CoA C-acetyltransferase [Deltaproteobacteria bacterium]|jgi:acetyl-CoA C-acetyltransferase|nr:acetyl-CoA C-acetyltransferase [Deltaproteobacteria bacterium]MBW2503206.1 acetyl-CoA C-acetyltransferase [Deltaproteobacteria bacterium]MBW2520016.1 acetyl-CoA C-acetyltransferase [Deltaproteobacteria bacterium]
MTDSSEGINSPTHPSGRPVYIIDGARTPFLKVRGKPGPFSPVDLAVLCGRPLLLRQMFPKNAIDQVILGCVNVLANEMNPARIAALRLGMGETMRAFTVQINCGSGMLSVDIGYRMIREGSRELILAGGTDSLSHAPVQFKQSAIEWLADLRGAGSFKKRAQHFRDLHPTDFKPEIALQSGLTDPLAGLSMGETAEILAHLFSISRDEADLFAINSHHRLAQAQKGGFLNGEIEPMISTEGELFDQDDGVRPDCSLASLAKLKPAFEKPFGQVTAGNSSQVTDGASWVILASEAMVKKYALNPRAVIIDSAWSAIDPEIMGLAPVMSIAALLDQQVREFDKIDLWEINEAFASQVLACLKAFECAEFCRQFLDCQSPLGRLNQDRLNVDGGAISLGHPVGASGNRIVLHLVNALQRLNLKRGIASECIGGGQSGAMLIETI